MSIGNGRSLIKCMNADGDPCDGFFSETMLQGALPEKVFQKYSEALARDALKSAHMEGIVTCCHCQIQMLLGPNAGKSDDCHVQYSTVHTYCIYCTYCTFYTCLRSFAQCQRWNPLPFFSFQNFQITRRKYNTMPILPQGNVQTMQWKQPLAPSMWWSRKEKRNQHSPICRGSYDTSKGQNLQEVQNQVS